MTSCAPASRRSRRRIALGVGVAAICLASTFLLVPSFRYRLREQWHLRRLGSGDIETRVVAAAKLLEMRSERGWLQMRREPRPLLEALILTEMADPVLALDSDGVERYREQPLTDEEIFRACSRYLRLEPAPENLLSCRDRGQLFASVRRLVEARCAQ